MSEEKNIWDTIVIDQLLKSDNLVIKEVLNFKTIADIYFDRSNYPTILSFVKSKNWNAISKMDHPKPHDFREYLSVVTFSDELQRLFAATIYDNDNLWQDPEIIDLIQF